MKQKIVIKVLVRCYKCRSKAMKIVAVADGVISVAWEGEDKDKVVVIGDGVDAATLTRKLSKKLCFADLLLVEEVKEKKEEKKEVKKEVKKEEKKQEKKTEKDIPEPTPQYPFEYRLCGPVVVYEDQCTSTCNIM